MSTFKKLNIVLIIILAGGVVAGCSGFSLPGRGGTAFNFGGRNWEVTLTRLKVIDAQEDRSIIGVPLSDGDEPYVIMFGVQSTFGTSGTTEVQVNGFKDTQWEGHLRNGQQRPIPVGMGSLRFENVSNSDVLGIVVIALESDRTPWAIIENRVELVMTDVREAVARSVEQRKEPDLKTTAFIDELHQSMLESVGPIASPLTTGQALENIVFSGVDTDEVIGVNTMVFMRRSPSRALNFPHYRQPYLTDILTNRDFLYGRNALIFQNNSLGATYEVELRVREF